MSWELEKQLVDAIEELEEDWRLLLGVLRAGRVVAAIEELVSVRDPLLFNEYLEARI